jgi:CheY-like chemotaxis protein
MKILIIDDNEKNTSTLSKFFNSKGFSTLISNEPMDGLRHIQQEKFDVILLDVNMHVVGEIGVIELLASDDILKEQNIFIFSEEDLPDIMVKNLLRRDGVAGFLKKSVDPEKLLTIITN